MRVPSTPPRVASDVSFSVPCGAEADVRKSLHPYSVAAETIVSAVPRSTGCFNTLIIAPFPLENGLLERSYDADAEHFAARIYSAVYPSILIADITRRSKHVRRR